MGAPSARAFGAALAVFLAGAHASGFPTSRLTYARGSGAEACPAEPTIRQAVAARLGYDPFFAAAEKTIVARIIRIREDLRATVELVDDHGLVRGVREFKARSGQCDELVATMALAISIAIDPTNPGILGDPPKAKPEPLRPKAASLDRHPPASERPALPTAPAPEVDAAEKPNDAEATSSELRVGAAVVGAIGTAPTATAGLALSAGIRRGIWSLNAEGRSELPGTIATDGGQVRTSLWAGGVAPCLHFDPLSICASVWLGSLRAQGVEFPTSRVDHAVYAATGVRLGLEMPVTERLFFRPELDVLATLFPVDLQVDGATQWTAPRFSTLLRAGLVARFP
jgi:hypothetical protein